MDFESFENHVMPNVIEKRNREQNFCCCCIQCSYPFDFDQIIATCWLTSASIAVKIKTMNVFVSFCIFEKYVSGSNKLSLMKINLQISIEICSHSVYTIQYVVIVVQCIAYWIVCFNIITTCTNTYNKFISLSEYVMCSSSNTLKCYELKIAHFALNLQINPESKPKAKDEKKKAHIEQDIH